MLRSNDSPARLKPSPVRSGDPAVRSADSPVWSGDLLVRSSDLPVRSADLPVRSRDSPVRSNGLAVPANDLAARSKNPTVRKNEVAGESATTNLCLGECSRSRGLCAMWSKAVNGWKYVRAGRPHRQSKATNDSAERLVKVRQLGAVHTTTRTLPCGFRHRFYPEFAPRVFLLCAGCR